MWFDTDQCNSPTAKDVAIVAIPPLDFDVYVTNDNIINFLQMNGYLMHVLLIAIVLCISHKMPIITASAHEHV